MAGKKRSILILEEDRADSMQMMLEEEFSVSSIRPAEAGEIDFSEKRPDCMILDTALSGVDTDSLMEEIHIYEIPLMIVADSEEEPMLAELIGAPLTTVLLRPFEKEKLLAKTKEFMKQIIRWQLERIAGPFEYRDRKLVLVVDEDRMIGSMIKLYLKEWYDVVQVFNTRIALNFMEYQVPDALLVDMELPKTDDVEIHRELRKKKHLKEIPFFYLTSDRDRITLLRVKSAGARSCIVKPIQKEELLMKLKEVLGVPEQTESRLQETTGFLSSRPEENIMTFTDSGKSNKRHILVVDDFSMALKTMKVQLEGDYQVTLAVSGKQALAFLEKHIPDLIFMDVEMPEMSGIEAVQKIKSNPKWKDIPVIFLTGNKDKDTIYSCMNLGAVDYMVKPVSVPKMQEKIRQILGRV